jgi:ABC-type sugar transport system permease subunit
MVARTARRRSGMSRQETRWVWLFLAPWVIGFLIFTGGPMIASLVLSFTEYDVISAPRFTGAGQLPPADVRRGGGQEPGQHRVLHRPARASGHGRGALAMAWLLFLVILAITVVQVRVGNRFVCYGGE